MTLRTSTRATVAVTAVNAPLRTMTVMRRYTMRIVLRKWIRQEEAVKDIQKRTWG